MTRIVEARAVISAQDNTGGALASISSRLMGITNTARQVSRGFGEATSVMGRRVQELAEQLRRVENFRGLHEGLARTRQEFRAAQAEVERLGRSMRDAGGNAPRDMTREYERAQRAVSTLSRAFEQQRAAVAQARGAMGDLGAGTNLNRLGAAQDALRARLERTTAAMERQAAAASRLTGAGRPTGRETGPAGALAHGAAGIGAAHMAREGGRNVVRNYATYDEAVRYQRAVAGVPADQQQPNVEQATRIGFDTRFSVADVLNAQTEAIQRLPPNLDRAGVARSVIEQSRYYSELMRDRAGQRISMQQGVEALMGYMMTTGQDMSTAEATARSARRGTNFLVEIAKRGGLDHDDIVNLYRRGPAGATIAGLSPETQGAIAIALRRQNVQGDVQSTFLRSISSRLAAPSRQALDAMAAMGINFQDFASQPVTMGVGGFEDMMRRRFNRGLNASQRERMTALFNDPEILSDRARFQQEAGAIAGEGFRRDRRGNMNAQDARALATALGEYHRLNQGAVNTEGLWNAIMQRGMTPALARGLFATEQGWRALMALRDPAQFAADREGLRNVPDNRAQAAAEEVTGGFYGALTRLQGGIENLFTRMGQVADGPLTRFTDLAARGIDAIAALPDRTLAFGTALTAATAALLTFRGAAAVGGAISGLLGGAAVGGAGAAAAGWLTGAARWLSPARLLGWGAAAYGGYEGANLLGGGFNAIQRMAQGEHYIPRTPDATADIREQIAERERRIAGIEGRLHPSMRGNFNPEVDALRREVADLRNRLSDRFQSSSWVDALGGYGERGRAGAVAPAAWADALGRLGERGAQGASHPETREIQATVRPDQISARLEGQAQVGVSVTVAPSADFISRVTSQVRSQMGHIAVSASAPGSPGTSMPEAAPGGSAGVP